MKLQLTPRNVAFILFKRRRAFTIFFAAVALLTVLYVILVPWRYESTAAIVVKVDEQNLADPKLQQPAGQAQPQANLELAKYIVNSHVDILESDDVARATLLKLGVAKIYPKIAANPPWFFGTVLDAAVSRFEKDLDVKVDKDSNTLLVGLYNNDPAVAQEALRTLIAAFMDKQAQVMRDPLSDFMKEQLDAARALVDKSQTAYLDYRQQAGVSSLTDERSLLLNQRDDIEESISEAEAKLASARSSRDALRASLATMPQDIQLSNENDQILRQVDSARDRLATAEQRYLEAKQSFAPDNPLLQDARAAVDLARQNFETTAKSPAGRVRSGVNPVRQTLETQLRQTEADLAAEQAATVQWQDNLKSVQARLDHIDRVEGEVSNLQRQLDVAVDDYKAYLARTEEARISEALNRQRITSLGISQEPNLPYQPKPAIPLILTLAVLVGFAGGVALCFALELGDATIGMPEQVESRIGLPVLVTLNHAGLAQRREPRTA
jgi:uncharacterized protein involved in exopolysaccharide biosynthesis